MQFFKHSKIGRIGEILAFNCLLQYRKISKNEDLIEVFTR